jgi:hypothetical protein
MGTFFISTKNIKGKEKRKIEKEVRSTCTRRKRTLMGSGPQSSPLRSLLVRAENRNSTHARNPIVNNNYPPGFVSTV